MYIKTVLLLVKEGIVLNPKFSSLFSIYSCVFFPLLATVLVEPLSTLSRPTSRAFALLEWFTVCTVQRHKRTTSTQNLNQTIWTVNVLWNDGMERTTESKPR